MEVHVGNSGRGWNVKKKRSRKMVCRLPHISTASCSEARQHKSTSAPPLKQVMKYMVPSLLALITLKYQGNSTESLFVENPIPVWCFLAASCVYWLLVGAMEQMPPKVEVECKCYKNIILSYAAVASGVLSPISLLSIFFPRQFWIPLPIAFAWPILKHARNLGRPNLSNGIIIKICTKVGWVKDESSLPV